MKKLMFALAFAAVLPAVAEDLAEWGGMITVWPKNCGKFVFVDAQDKVPAPLLEKPIAQLGKDFSIDIRKVSGDAASFDLRTVPAALKKLEAKGAIWIVNDPALPASLAAGDNGWGLLNVAPLVADSPDEKVLGKRVVKSINRVFANIHGASESMMMPGCVMKQVVGVAELDALNCENYSPEAFGKVSNYLNKFGYKRVQTGTYYDACEEGWAPAPTNAVQKQIWDKIHQMPTKPIKILPPSRAKK